MKITLVGSYTPRKCGIATFTENLKKAIDSNFKNRDSFETSVVALNDFGNTYNYNDKEVKFIIAQDNLQDYIDAASFINKSKTDVCILQHEYGIFGGDSGIYVLQLINQLRVPLVTTIHTVLKKPSFLQKLIIQQIAKHSFKIVVMSNLAIEFLKSVYEIPAEKILLIEHGVPDAAGDSLIAEKELFEFRNRRLLLTFGLLSKNKGIETVIRALPEVVQLHPDILYVVLGNTHPSVLRNSGEEYRDYLINLSKKLSVHEHVYFIDKFVSEQELFSFLKVVDIYITPYLNEEQITSGTLSYAVGAGAASISTPYWHARELLAEGRGILFPFKSSESLSNILNELLSDKEKLERIKANATAYGKKLKWPNIGSQYIKLSCEAIRYYNETSVFPENDFTHSFPAFSLDYIKRLTDNTGIVQHAKYGIPNLKEGYCLDDNARAMITVLMAYRQYRTKESLELLPVYLSYIHYMQREDGWFRNFLHFNRNYLDELGSEDSFGRSIWALCYLICYAPNHSYQEFASELFHRSSVVFKELRSLRGIANVIIGISYYLKSYPSNEELLNLLSHLSEKLITAYSASSDEACEWYWFEEILTYDNGILPLALLHSYEITGNSIEKKIGLKTLQFLKQKTFRNGYFSAIGNNGWHSKNQKEQIALFDQQAIEAMAMILLLKQAFKVTKDNMYTRDMKTCFAWFLGKNDLHIPLYDHETHGCCDGLEATGVNRNQGAESTLAYLISYLAVVSVKEPGAIPAISHTHANGNKVKAVLKI